MPIATRPGLVPSPIELLPSADARLLGIRYHGRPVYLRVRAGIYVRAAAWDALPPWLRYLARVHAFRMLHPDAVFCLESAAALRGSPTFGEPRDIHVFDAGRAASRRFGDVCVHTSRNHKQVERVDGTHLTTRLQTAVDLIRVLPPAFAVAVGSEAISPQRGGTTTVEALRELAGHEVARRGRARLEIVLPLLDARSESVGEDVSRAVIHWLGFEDPELQVEFHLDGFIDRTDFFWRRASAIGESDGYAKYDSETHDEMLARIIREKQREDRLRRQCRAFRRWDWAATVRVTPLEQRIAELGVARVREARPALLATLRSNPRSLRPTGPTRPARPAHTTEKPLPE